MQCRFTESTNVHTERGKGIRQESQVIYLKDIGPTVQWSDKCFGSQCRETQRHPEINEKSQMQLRHSLFWSFETRLNVFFWFNFFSVHQWHNGESTAVSALANKQLWGSSDSNLQHSTIPHSHLPHSHSEAAMLLTVGVYWGGATCDIVPAVPRAAVPRHSWHSCNVTHCDMEGGLSTSLWWLSRPLQLCYLSRVCQCPQPSV